MSHLATTAGCAKTPRPELGTKFRVRGTRLAAQRFSLAYYDDKRLPSAYTTCCLLRSWRLLAAY